MLSLAGRLVAIITVVLLGLSHENGLRAQSPELLVDDFEGVHASWEIQPSDSLQVVSLQRRTDRSPLRGHRCELAVVVGRRGGDTIYAAHDVTPCAVIEEFAAKLWVRGNRDGYQLFVRVRLPRALDESGEPMSMLLPGDQYAAVGQWQQLVVTDLGPKLASMTRVLRARFQRPIDPAEAYVDMVVVNVFGSAGTNRIWFDDLTLEGAIRRRPSDGHNVLLASATSPSTAGAVAIAHGNVMIDEKPFVPRGVTYRGESLATLAQMGFNTLWLDRLPDDALLESSRQHQLWLICPPPDEHEWTKPMDRVLCWCFDQRRAGAHRHPLAARIQRVRSTDRLQRPIALVREGNDTAVEHLVDIVMTPRDAPKPASREVATWQVMGEPLGNWSRWLPLRAGAHAGLEEGCRGFLLRTAVRLDDADAAHAARLAELLNLELTTVRPWTTVPPRRLSTPLHRLSMLSNEHSSLILVRRLSTESRYELAQPIEVADHARREVYFVEPGGLSPARHFHVPGGVRISLRPDQRSAILLVTDRAGVIEQLNRHLRETGPRINELLIRVAREELLRLDQRIDHRSTTPAFKSDLRKHLHRLQSHFAPVLDSQDQNSIHRELGQLLWRLEGLQAKLDEATTNGADP